MRKILSIVAFVALLAFAAQAFASRANAASGVTDSGTLHGLAQVRQATTKYHDVNQALADGYVPVTGCVQLPGVGVMGIHYLNSKLASDMTIDPLRPEQLLYVPSPDGPRLVGVEYFEAYVGQPAPSVFGQTFNGPMAGHSPGMPWHYDLHTWVWQANPAGTFAQWNPSLSC